MHVVITGGAGFLGSSLARAILRAGTLCLRGAAAVQVDRLTLVDRVPPPADLEADPRVAVAVGDIAELLSRAGTTGPPAAEWLEGADVVYHLAAAVSGECEANFDLGLAANLDASRLVLQACRALGTRPVLVFASSVAVYGAWPGSPLPDLVTDATAPTPRSSYGAQKLMVEHLVADATRKGFVDGRTVRLMTVSVRPGLPNAAASSFLSSIVREPLRGVRATCPVPRSTTVALSSPARAIEGLLAAAQTSAKEWGSPLGLNLPALEVSVDGMVAALTEVAGPEVAALIDWVPDPAIEAIVTGWPSRFDPARARALGLAPDPDYASIVRGYIAMS